jgi:hypothetical protein
MSQVIRQPLHALVCPVTIDRCAAETIQRIWRGSQVRFFGPRHKQMGPQPFGHISLTRDTDFLNLNHSVWQLRRADLNGQRANHVISKRTISFSDECLVRAEEDKVVTTDFHDTPDKVSRLFANTIVSLFVPENCSGFTPLYRLFCHPNAPSLEPYFRNTIAKMESGQRVSIWDGQSTKLNPSDNAINAIKTCFVKYNYFMKSFDPTNQTTTNQPTPNQLVASILEGPLTCSVTPMATAVSKPMGLARVAERTICGVKMVNQVPEFSVEDLEERLHKLMNLSYSK